MKVNQYPASSGLQWLREGVRLVRRQPLGLPAMMVIYLLILVGPLLVPLIGIGIAGVLAPFASLGWLAVCRDAAAGRPPTPSAYAQAFRDGRGRVPLLRLGFVNAALVIIVAILALMLTPAPQTTEAPQSLQDIPIDGLVIQLLLYAPVAAVMWFAPPLAGWHGMSPAKAMFGSAVACWRNLGPLLIFAVAAGVLVVSVSVLAAMALSSFGISREWGSMLLAPLVLVLAAIVQASFYPMYRAVFETEPPEQPSGSDLEPGERQQ